MGSLIAMPPPQYDRGDAMTLTVMLRAQTHGYQRELLGEYVWTANLFGRAVQHLKLPGELQKANDKLNAELKTVSRIQRSLLPSEIPDIPDVDLAAYCQTAHRAGGDYYDFFRIDENRCGILIADGCWHGADAAVLMAITHADPESASSPGKLPGYINANLYENYTKRSRALLRHSMACTRAMARLTYASAGHDSPKIVNGSGGAAQKLVTGINLPLGIFGTLHSHRLFRDAKDKLLIHFCIEPIVDRIADILKRLGLRLALRMTSSQHRTTYGAPILAFDQDHSVVHLSISIREGLVK